MTGPSFRAFTGADHRIATWWTVTMAAIAVSHRSSPDIAADAAPATASGSQSIGSAAGLAKVTNSS
jgi:hypothetical protein